MGGYLRRGFRFSQSCTVRISSGSAKTQTVQSVRCCLLRFMDRGGVLPLACVFTISYIIPQKFSSCKILCTGLCEITPKINFLFHPMIFSIHFLLAEKHKKGQPGKPKRNFPSRRSPVLPDSSSAPRGISNHRTQGALCVFQNPNRAKAEGNADRCKNSAGCFKVQSVLSPLFFNVRKFGTRWNVM